MEMLEAQLAGSSGLKDKYHARRAEFLEDKVATLVRQAIPSGTIYRNLIWCDPKEGETDILVLVDLHALIIECKSGRIKPSAKRGGASLGEEIKDLIQDPTEAENVQASRGGACDPPQGENDGAIWSVSVFPRDVPSRQNGNISGDSTLLGLGSEIVNDRADTLPPSPSSWICLVGKMPVAAPA